MSHLNKEKIAERMKSLQAYICTALEKVDGVSLFISDPWDREQGGGGITRIIQNGGVIEKGGVAFSTVHGEVTETMQKQMGIEGNSFFATGVSIVLHPHSPHVPIIHMNVRYFELDNGTFWFGGGIDLTPHYVIESQAKVFHQGLKNICDYYNIDFYPQFKNWADDYFYIPHRNETRGVGGIFFDHLTAEKAGLTKDEIFNFCIELGENFPILYKQQVELGKNIPITEHEIQWRNLRRGRYVEFNLVNDRGTKFGLVSNGRTESILMSLPANASWEYNYQAPNNSREKQTLLSLKKGINRLG
ncbi:MAG: oxygen-dependent coproporphyrinogen oxidase [Flavobacteriia bacterium]|nr:oxygen-dependent coproporphyrinogen oxidase [Flavobacteriia bacterium]